jgi:UDP-GlcNAc:undecaprenyl-phosphate GlcNAc-1-phosphate transferase
MPWLTLLISFILGLAGVYGARWLGRKVGAVVQPRDDRWAQVPTPYLGGVGIFLAFTIAVLITGDLAELDLGIVIAGAVAFFLGLADDIWDLSPQTKLVGLLIAATIVVVFGNVTAFFPYQLANILISIIWLIGIANAVNLLDNMDGLAAGTVIIASAFMAYFFYQANNLPFVLLSLAITGATLGFWIFNFPPASIFMGDSGSLFLGMTMAGLAIAREPQASNVFAILGIPTLIFLLPILDTIMVSVTRLLRGQSPAKGGRDHTSHRLISLGLNERQTLLVLMIIGLVSGISAVLLESINYYLSLALIPIVVLIFSLFSAYLGKISYVDKESSRSKPQNIFIRVMADLTYRRRILEVLLDLFIITFAYYLAFIIHLGLPISQVEINQFIETLPIIMAGTYLSFFIFGIYRGVWQYFSMEDGLRYMLSILLGVGLSGLVIWYAYGFDLYPGGVLFVNGLLIFVFILGSRISFRLLDRIIEPADKKQTQSVLIYGAGGGGIMALREIHQNRELNYRPLGFIDDDPILKGRVIQGLTVLGGVQDLDEILTRQPVEGVIIASRFIETSKRYTQVREICQGQKVWIKILRIEFNPLDPKKPS